MSKDGGPALVQLEMRDGVVVLSSQLSMRDYFAAQALVGISQEHGWSPIERASRCYTYADAMLAERSK